MCSCKALSRIHALSQRNFDIALIKREKHDRYDVLTSVYRRSSLPGAHVVALETPDRVVKVLCESVEWGVLLPLPKVPYLRLVA